MAERYELGQDIDQVEELLGRLRAQHKGLTSAHDRVMDAANQLTKAWRGTDAQRGIKNARHAATQAALAATSVKAMATALQKQVEEQRQASAGSGGAGSTPTGPTTPVSQDDTPYDPDHPFNDDVHDETTEIPGLDDGFVPQGLYIDEDGNRYVTGYDEDDVNAGTLYIQDPQGNVIATIPLDGIDHYGGVAVDGDHVYVSGGGKVQLYSLQDLMAANGSSNAPDPVDTVNVGASSTVTYHDGHIWVANFDEDDGNQQILSYPVGDDGRIQQASIPFFGNYGVPNDELSGPSQMQGIAVDDDYVYVAQSYLRDSEDSHITRIDRHTGEEVTIDVPSNMLEGIALHDGQLVQLYESGADKYEDGGREPRDNYSHIHVD